MRKPPKIRHVACCNDEELPAGSEIVSADHRNNYSAINTQQSTSRRHGYTAAANDVLKMQFGTGGGSNAHFLSRYFEIIPVRIS